MSVDAPVSELLFELIPATETTPESIHANPPQVVGAASLQSPDDRQATYRTTDLRHLVGYKASAAETCAPENPFQLITSIQVAPNLADDQAGRCPPGTGARDLPGWAVGGGDGLRAPQPQLGL